MSVEDRLYRRNLMASAPAKILATNDTGPIHLAQVNLNGGPEIIDQLGVMQHYGLNTHAPIGSDAVAIFIAGQRSNGVIVATNNQKARVRNLKPGEVSVYTDEGDSLHFGREQAVALTAGNSFNATTKAATIKGSDSVTLDAPTTTVTQNLKAHGNVDASGGFFVNGVPIGSGGGGGPGPPGPQGPAGEAATIAVGTTTTGAAGTPAAVVNVGTPSAAIFDFTIPQGIQGVPGAMGATGSPGAAASIAVGTTTTGAPGTAASVTNTGSSAAAVFNFTIPAGLAGATGATGSPGTPGAPGAAGAAATIAVGTTTTGAAGSAAAVTNSGNSSAAVFNFTIPQGIQGIQGIQGPAGAPGSTPAIGGSNLQIQYNNAGALGGMTNWTFVTPNLIGNFSGSPAPSTAFANALQLVGLTGTQVGIQIDGFAGNAVMTYRRADGTAAAPSAMLSGETLGQINFTGYTGAAYGGNVVIFRAVTTQAWTTAANGAGLVFGTTANGATANVQTMALGMGGLGGLTLGSPATSVTDMGQGTVNASVGYYINGASIFASPTFTGTVTAAGINATGRQCRSGLAGPAQGNYFNINWVGTVADLWIDNTDLTVGLGVGSINFSNATSNWILFPTAGIAAPTMTTRSAGTRLVLYPSLSGTATDYAIGIQSGAMWFSGGGTYVWYAAATQIASLSSAGALTLSGGLSAAGAIQATGTNSALFCYSRDSGTVNWGLYAQGGVARIWNSPTGDLVTIGTTGNVGMLAGATLTIGNVLTSAAPSGIFTISGTPTITGSLTCAGACQVQGLFTIGATMQTSQPSGAFTIAGAPTITGQLTVPGGVGGQLNPGGGNNTGGVGSSTLAWNQMNSYNWFTASDRGEKTNIEDLPASLDLVEAIAPKRFRWVEGEDERMHWGFIAQDVGEAMAEAGHDFGGHQVDPEGPERLAYNELIAVLWQATRELAARVAHLEAAA